MTAVKDFIDGVTSAHQLGIFVAITFTIPAVMRFSQVLVKRLPRRNSLVIWLGLHTLAAIVWCVYNLFFAGIPTAFAASDIGIAVFKVEGDSDDTVRNSFKAELKDCISHLPPEIASRIRISYVDRPLPHDPEEQAREAIKLGHRVNASIVTRFVPIINGFQALVTVIDAEHPAGSDSVASRISREALARPDAIGLACEMATLSHIAIGLSLYKSGKWEQAGKEIKTILSGEPLPSIGPSRAYLNFLLGNTYVSAYIQAQYTSSVYGDDRIQSAVKAYDEALREWVGERYQRERGLTLVKRGSAVTLLSGPKRADVLRSAILTFSEALELLPMNLKTERQEAKYGRAAAQTELAAGPEARNTLLASRDTLNELLTEYDPSKQPQLWAQAMNELGMVHSKLSSFAPPVEAAKEAETAIHCFDQSITVFTEQAYPDLWATVMTNRSNAFLELPTGNAVDNLREAVRCAYEALRVRTKPAHPVEFAVTSLSLGLAYLQLAHRGDEIAYSQALLSFDQALEVLTSRRQPVLWSRAVISRFQAYEDSSLPKTADGLRQSILSLTEAQQIGASLSRPDILMRAADALSRARRRLGSLETE